MENTYGLKSRSDEFAADDGATGARDNARGGQYTFTVQATGEASSANEFNGVFLANFTCRLVLFRFRDTNKDPRNIDELAATEFRPEYAKESNFKLDRFLGSAKPGANFSIGNGLGVAVIVEKKTPGTLALPKNERSRATLRIRSVTLEFSPAPRDENDSA